MFEWYESLCDTSSPAERQTRALCLANEPTPMLETDPILVGRIACKNRVSAPLVLEGEIAGFVALANKPGGFDEGDVKLVHAIGEIMALSVQRERYLQQLLSTEQLLTATGRMARVGGWEVDLRARRWFGTHPQGDQQNGH